MLLKLKLITGTIALAAIVAFRSKLYVEKIASNNLGPKITQLILNAQR
jgi:hypothetical protein